MLHGKTEYSPAHIVPGFLFGVILNKFVNKIETNMRITIGFFMLILAMLIVGKIGHIGVLGGLSWLQVSIALMLEIVVQIADAYLRSNRVYENIVYWFKQKAIKREQNRNAEKFKNMINKGDK